ncbi:MAG: WecB/TagA/CpsF family glycosyltransferase [Anaerolineales bacterium]|nr:WecB/TagA/CpsF family glycosyltransferase [Anaerolineales bacterium]
MIETTEILGVRVAQIDRAGILAQVAEWVHAPGQHLVSYVNANCLNVAARDAQYLSLLNRCDLVYSDGIGVVWAARFLNGKHLYKITGRDWIDHFCTLAEQQGISIYILAGEPGVAQRASGRMQKRWPGIRIAGAVDGFFNQKSEEQVIAEINASQPHLLFVGMGVPQQEKWIARNQDRITVPVCWAVGALFDYIAGDEAPVPAWMEKLALEWLWRLFIDPLGKWKRYMFGNPLFLLRVVISKLQRK